MLRGVTTAPFGFLRVAAAGPRLKVADPDYNVGEILGLAAEARRRGVQVAVFPELALTGYTAGDLFFSVSTLVGGAERALARLLRETAESAVVLVVGLPVAVDSQLFNAVVVVQSGRLLGRRAEELPARLQGVLRGALVLVRPRRPPDEVRLAGQAAPFGTDLLFAVEAEPGVVVAVEICEDLWVPIPPSSHHAVAGATIIVNASASVDYVGKADYRRELVRQQSGRTISAYVLANTGVHESTTDAVFGGHLLVAEDGAVVAEGERFRRDNQLSGGRRRHGTAPRRADAPDLLLRRLPRPPVGPRRVTVAPDSASRAGPAPALRRPPSLRPQGRRHPRRALPRDLLDPDRRPREAPRAHGHTPRPPGLVGRPRLDPRPARDSADLGPPHAAA